MCNNKEGYYIVEFERCVKDPIYDETEYWRGSAIYHENGRMVNINGWMDLDKSIPIIEKNCNYIKFKKVPKSDISINNHNVDFSVAIANFENYENFFKGVIKRSFEL